MLEVLILLRNLDQYDISLSSLVCKGDKVLTHICPTLPEVQRVQSMYEGYYDFVKPIVSQHLIQPMVYKVVEPM